MSIKETAKKRKENHDTIDYYVKFFFSFSSNNLYFSNNVNKRVKKIRQLIKKVMNSHI